MPRPRLRFLWLLLFVGLAPAQQALRPLTILHTNDIHARLLPDANKHGGFAYLAGAIRKETASCRWCLVLNGGDIVQGSPVSTIFRGLPVYRIANGLGLDVSTLGNHEFDYGWRRIPEFLRAARFEVVSANVVDENGRLLADRAYTIRKVNGIRVAVIGALTADLPELSTPDLYGPWRALPVVETVRRYATQVRDQADLIVVLGHLNNTEEDDLLRLAPEIAVVISGHVHRGLETPKMRDGRLVVRVKAYTVELGRLDLQVDVPHKKATSASWRRIEIDADTIPPAKNVARLVTKWEAKVSKLVDIPIGESKREFSGPALKALLEQAMAEEMGADLAFMNEGGIRDFLPRGPLLARNVWNISPFDNKVVVGRFKGRELPALVKEGRPIDAEREYSLAVSEFTAANQKVELGSNGLVFPQTGPLQRDLLIQWIKKKKVLE